MKRFLLLLALLHGAHCFVPATMRSSPSKALFLAKMEEQDLRYTIPLEEISLKDLPKVGG